ncbi:MAG: bifunctional 2-C-methyl-D-erythritol 4-phosphate cytidylyltransferase/2-C-methyl-D-erythritol 2,4-cyclodiphosphate synthase [Sulfurovum sp.]|nr:bifunctional 2-C-methyl-D-erythritol 4-phosphate cytidylyltransferase/2-C-methyl-D-erythritol 2,4-cyclodiphosphate synthase [Sulfurovum sp.]MCB4745264.1 bifunctional 2-C-methyl-D-erythritol 4-phosphate cytidylyltransferase/2-C-methyl-D-erythritol 2,4-cyclodiphosphate synthase [Sulfurovum sp.]MCB4745772.1 bifunctional 2-C-methyl-D-erythritol 4-phosphate cytidylyltransferase/2-C-methyl-D-erythritol 2,4-cyclodiphosphate synthase [Sulfurovum sp.]MCB4749321.1 bifunctional 2-C-methyl-D-erythritol 4
MSKITLILLGAGNSSRFKSSVKKQWLYSGETPLWLQVAQQFEATGIFANIIIVSSTDEIHYMKYFADYTFIAGSNSRQASLINALSRVETEYVMVSDIARCCVPCEMIMRILDAKEKASCIVPVLPIADTLYMDDTPINREKVRIIQTPQLSVTKILKKALSTEQIFTDESSAIMALGEKVHFVDGSPLAHKLTTQNDLEKLSCLHAPTATNIVGFGIDIHPFENGKIMKLCGVTIDVNYGFKAHSDGDVAIHALIDALMGASGMGDIGEFYPDTDPTYADIDSTEMLEDIVKRINSYGLKINNVDITIMAQVPRLLPYKTKMRTTLASLLGITPNRVNIKATTAEKLGFVGRKEGITVYAVANLTYFNWKKYLNSGKKL